MQSIKFVIGGLLASLTLSSNAGLYEQISDAVEQRIRAAQTLGDIQVSHPQSPRLGHLEACSALEVHNVTDRWYGSLRFQVRCPDWQLYWPVEVAVFLPVVQAANDISRNQLIDAEDLTLSRQNIANLRLGYYRSPEDVIGTTAARNLAAGMVINHRLITAPALVERNDRVVITAKRAGLEISMAGVALEDGALDEQIRVQNLSSGQTIRATVVDRKVVQVTLAP